MHYGWMYGMGMGWGWILLLGVLGLLVWFAARGSFRGQAPPTQSPRESPEEVLKARFARGEIDENEYRRRIGVLHSRS